jgi:hypothetical protein
MSTNDLFSDLQALRISGNGEGGGGTGVREHLAHVPVRKPNRHEFFRVHPDTAMSLPTAILEDKDERETFIVAPGMRDALLGELKPVLLVTFITRQGVIGIWPLALPGEMGRRNDWHETAREAAELAKTYWVRLSADTSLGAYRIHRAGGELSEPTWPPQTLGELLQIAFRDRVIDAETHPFVRRLRGLA